MWQTSLDKAKPFVRRGRKATDLPGKKIAGLPKELNCGEPGFFIGYALSTKG